MILDLAIIKILCTIAIFQSALIIFYLFIQKRGTFQSRLILSFLLTAFAVFVLGTFLLLISRGNNLRFYGHLMNLTIFLAAPLLFLYFRSSMYPDHVLNLKTLLHFVPFLVIFILMFEKLVILKRVDFVFKPYGISLLTLLFVQNIAYLYVITTRLVKFRSTMTDRAKFRWFDFILKSFLVLFTVKLVIFIIWNILRNVFVCVFITNIFFILSFILINTIILYALNKPDLLIGAVKYQYSSMTPPFKTEFTAKLEELMKVKEAYADPLISLKKVAGQLHISEKQLSQLVNEVYGMNFNEYINKYRIEKALKLMHADTSKCKKILEIGYEVGFNSKTTFNAAFRKFTGKSPSEYRLD
jgi:AraC-like DNA-binding protein